MKTSRFTRKSFEVEAIRITHENFEEVRAWCDGEEHGGEYGKFFKVDIKTAVSERARRAHIGDWVLRSETGFRIYTNNAFRDFFIPVRSGVEILNSHLRRPDVFPGEPAEMTEDLGFELRQEGRDMMKPQERKLRQERYYGLPFDNAKQLEELRKAQERDLTMGKPKPPRPLTAVRTAKNTGRQVGFGKN